MSGREQLELERELERRGEACREFIQAVQMTADEMAERLQKFLTSLLPVVQLMYEAMEGWHTMTQEELIEELRSLKVRNDEQQEQLAEWRRRYSHCELVALSLIIVVVTLVIILAMRG